MDLEEDLDRTCDTAIVGDPVLEALYNDVILDNIFKTCTNIKNCRLICKKWNGAILSQKPPRIILRLDKIIIEEHVPQLERKLARKIYTYDPEKGNLQRFCEEYGDEVEKLKFNYEHDEPAPIQGLIYVLEKNLCPNLRSLFMSWHNVGDCADFPLNLPLMPKLKFLTFWYFDRLLSKDCKNFLQLVVKNSPNLMKIEYSGPFDIDFSGNSKIKNIKHWLDSDDKIDANGLKKTLAQTANSLEKLHLALLLGDDERDIEDDDDECIDFPIMPKLTSLELLSADDPKVGRNLNDLTFKLLPSLKYLKLENYTGSIYDSSTELKILHDLVERGSYKHIGVVKLSLGGVKNPLLLKDLRLWFPNLETFEVALIPSDYSENLLEKLFKILKDAKLKIIKIRILYKYDTVELIDALEPNYMDLFKDLKLLYLENHIDYDVCNTDRVASNSRSAWKEGKSGAIETFEKILLHINEVRGLKVVFNNFLLNGSIARRILGYIDENKINFIFL